MRRGPSKETSERMPRYWRAVSRLQAGGRDVVSSVELAEEVGVSAAVVRRDFAFFGRFGTRGRGYRLDRLCEELRTRLGLDRCWRVTIVRESAQLSLPAGILQLEPGCFDIVSIYELNPTSAPTTTGGRRVSSMTELGRRLGTDAPDIGIVAVAGEKARRVVDLLVAAGVRAILSYTTVRLDVPDGVELTRVDPLSMLESMTLRLSATPVSTYPAALATR